jgi:hypothetical protein
MAQSKGLLTPEERARIAELQDVLIDRFVEHSDAIADGREAAPKSCKPRLMVSCAKRKRSRIGRPSDRHDARHGSVNRICC